MGLRIRRILVLVLLTSWPAYAHAISALPWQTTFNYGACSQRGQGGQPDCGNVATDGIYWNWGAVGLNGKYTQNTSAANNPAGGGGNGARFWVGDGFTVGSASVRVDLPGHMKEVWVRWYERYQAGFKWSGGNPDFSKELYFTTDGAGVSAIVEPHYDGYAIVAQGTSNYYQVQALGYGWSNIMGGAASDGKFHCYEVHLKMDTNSTNGVGQLWIDGVLRASNTKVDWSGGNSAARNGWYFFEMKSNQNSPANGQDMYVDIDDMAIYSTSPPNKDAQGNPMIGPLNWAGGSGTNVASAPTGLTIKTVTP